MTSGDVSKIFQAILKKAGLLELPGKRFTTHGLRHLFAVQNIKKCADAGEDFYNWIQYLCRYMGHKHIRYTLYYLHITSQLSQSTGRSWTPLRKESVWSMRKNKQKPKKMFFIYTKDFSTTCALNFIANGQSKLTASH